MATRYLVAMDHVDLHARKVMRKYAQNRPLGEIERKYLYIASQSTGPIDGQSNRIRTKGYFSTDQHGKGYPRNRQSKSAPAYGRVDPNSSTTYSKETQANTPYINVSVQGRPATGVQAKKETPSKPRVWKRPKTTSHLKDKRSTKEFMTVKIDPDILLSSRRNRELTNQIREQWDEANLAIGFGPYSREPKDILNSFGAESSGQWMAFSGNNQDNCQGVVDAFTSLTGNGQTYSIDGYSGSRVARQLNKGGQIRIGRNGTVSRASTLPETKSKTKDAGTSPPKPVPLCWTDQLAAPEAKIIKCKSPPLPSPTKNLCETHPVIFTKLIPSEPERPKLATPVSPSFRTEVRRERKLRKKPSGTAKNGHTQPRLENNVPILDSKTDTSSSLSDGEQVSNQTKNSLPSKSEKKSSRGTGCNSIQHDRLTPKTLLSVKRSPVSFQSYSTEDPGLSINVTGSKASLAESPRRSPRLTFPSNKEYLSTSDLSQSVLNGSQTEFIHFTTGLILPLQRREKTIEKASDLISQVDAHNKPRVLFPEPSSTSNRDMGDPSPIEPSQNRPNTPVSPEGLQLESPVPDEVALPGQNQNIAFSIPTGDFSIGDGSRSPALREETPDVTIRKSSLSTDQPDSDDQQLVETPGIRNEVVETSLNDRPFTASSDHSDYSSGGSSISTGSTHNLSRNTPNRKGLTVRFQTEEIVPTVRELLHSQVNIDGLDASLEVQRLRQQIKSDLQKQQEETQSDIEYMRLKRSYEQS